MVSGRFARKLGCWPTASQERLLRAALFDRPDALEAWRQWRSAVDIENVDTGSFRLLPLLYRNLSRHRLADPLMSRLKGVHRQSWYRNQLLFRRTADVLRSFHAAGIETLVLKGIPLSLRYYKDEAVRPMTDSDVVVHRADSSRAVEMLQQLGWRSHRPLPAWPVPHLGSWAFVDDDGHEIDLHWHVFADCLADHADDDLWAAAEPIAVCGIETKALSAADQLLHVLVHGIHWNPVPSIRWVADAVAILESSAKEVSAERFVEQATRRRFVPIVRRGLGYLRDVLTVPVPADLLGPLTSRPEKLSDRLDLWSRADGGAIAGAFRMWDGYVRSLEEGRRLPDPLGFMRYLRARWLADSFWDLPSVMRSKVTRRRLAEGPDASVVPQAFR